MCWKITSAMKRYEEAIQEERKEKRKADVRILVWGER